MSDDPNKGYRPLNIRAVLVTTAQDLREYNREERTKLRGLTPRPEDRDEYIAIGAKRAERGVDFGPGWVSFVEIGKKPAYSCGDFDTREDAIEDAMEAAEDLGIL